ncbi:MAG: hypothetical protein HYZ66_05290 [Chlamydiae bacterium]|nr:hypothetical protein [Chlamydiota bacterium]
MALKHELVHWLAFNKVLKIDPSWEFTTFAAHSADRIIGFAEGVSEDEKAHAIEEGEKDFFLHSQELVSASPDLARRLYERGKALYAEKGETVFELKAHVVGDRAEYFSIDRWLEETIKLFEDNHQSTDHLKLYLAYSKRPPQNEMELRQYESVQYSVQATVGILFAGVLVARYQTVGEDPLRFLKRYFDDLYDVFGEGSEEDEQWVKDVLLPEAASFAGTIFGRPVEWEAAKEPDLLGFYKYISPPPQDPFAVSKVQYWAPSLRVPMGDKSTQSERRREVRERLYGHLMLAKYRAVDRPGRWFDAEHAETLKDPVLAELWEYMLIPSSIYRGHHGATGKIREQSSAFKTEYEGIPEEVRDLLKSLFELGNPDIEKQAYLSYPLRFQYLCSILRMYSFFEGGTGEKLEDPRVEAEGRVAQALTKTYDAWRKVFFDRTFLDPSSRIHGEGEMYKGLFTLVRGQILETYRELYEEDRRIEKEREEEEAQRHIRPAGRNIGSAGRNIRPTGRNIRPTGRHIRPAGRNIGSAGRHIRPAGRDIRPTGRHIRSAGRDIRPAGRNIRPAGRNIRPAGRHIRPAGRDIRPTGRHIRSAGRDIRPAGRNIRPAGRNIRPAARNTRRREACGCFSITSSSRGGQFVGCSRRKDRQEKGSSPRKTKTNQR